MDSDGRVEEREGGKEICGAGTGIGEIGVLLLLAIVEEALDPQYTVRTVLNWRRDRKWERRWV
jgi:hypothetical protein